MDAAAATPIGSAGNAVQGTGPPFLTVIAYEDSASFERAHVTLDRLVAQFGLPGESKRWMWPFDQLQLTDVRREAAAIAARADLVLVAAQCSTHLPEAVKNWIWSWLPLRQARGGALALTFADCAECQGASDRPESLICAAMRRAAALGRMDVVCSRSNWQGPPEEACLRRMLERAHKSSTVLEGILSRRGIPIGGLNE
jgi:ketopantoate reductase